MSHRASDNSKVSLFPFLAVLLCTMGALLVLLVVLAQQAARRTRDVQIAESEKRPAANVAESPDASSESAERVAKLREAQERLNRFEQELEQKLNDEKSRLQHLEDHSRRLEHELAQLYLANEQLEAAKEDQQIDQEQAERELARLKQLVVDSQEQLEALQAEAKPPKSYAILPYRGPNGTLRPPMHIECSQDRIVIQPTGIELTEQDFEPPVRPSNALAAAIRATREHYAKQSEQTGQELGEPYPLIIVRADGRNEYRAVLSALTAADVDYGYEFVNADKRLKYPSADPQLASAQNHAVFQARAWQEQLARSAPRRFASRQVRVARAGRSQNGGTSFGGGNDAVQSAMGGSASGAAGARYGYGDESGDQSSGGNGGGGSAGMGESGSQLGDASPGEGGGKQRLGELAGGASGGDQAGGMGSSGAAGSSGSQEDRYASGGEDAGAGETGSGGAGEASSGSGSTSESGGAQGGAQSNGARAGGSASAGDSVSNQAQGASGAGSSSTSDPNSQQNSMGSPSFTKTFANSSEDASAAGARGADWALNKTRGQSVAMRRPIPVIVSSQGLTLVPNQDAVQTSRIAPETIRFDQATDQLLDEFATKLRKHTEEWGLAGRGLHWRPVLVMKVAPGAAREADRLARLLEGSGVDIQFSQTAARPEETNRATR